MIKNYFITALRNLNKTRLFTLTNIFGLSVGMAIFLLIFNYVNFERSYDKFHDNYERIYRVRYERYSDNGESVRFASCCPPIGLRIRNMFPEVEKVARIFRMPASVSYSENRFFEERLFFAEPEFFQLFSFKFIEGDSKTGINSPNTAFISKSTAQKYFGNENPIGKTISVDKKIDFLVKGIFEDIPQNSHIKMDIVLPWANLLNLIGSDYDDSWGDSGAFTYVLFREGANIDEFKQKLDKVAYDEFGEALKSYHLTMTLPLQPLTDIHLKSHYQQEFESNNDKFTVDLLMIVALFIMIIAWVNYINLSTARSITRAKEVGLRKSVGASRIQLMNQFFMEVVVINFLAVVAAIILTLAFQPLLKYVIEVYSIPNIFGNYRFWLGLSALFIIGIFLSGLYPVFVLSSFKPIQVLRGKFINSTNGVNIRKALVVFQFTMAMGLLAYTFAIFKQIDFMRKQNLGFSYDKVLVVRGPRVLTPNHSSNVQSFKQEILRNPSIQKMCVVTEVPGRQVYWDAGGIAPVGSDESKNYQIVGVDYDFVDFFETKIIEGRSFSRDFPSDTVGLVLNETAVKWMGFPNPKSSIGKQVDYWGVIYTIIGVMQNYHQQSPKMAFEPHLYRLMPTGRGSRSMYAFKVNNPNSLDAINKQFNAYFPNNAFEYFFLDDYYNEQYKSDKITGKVFSIFSILALLVTALGTLGLFSFLISQRTKEIGVRSVLGANTQSLFVLFSKSFVNLTILSFLIAIPISYYFINQWLNTFSQKMSIGVSVFILPIIIIISIALSTIGYQVLRATRANPVDSLRTE